MKIFILTLLTGYFFWKLTYILSSIKTITDYRKTLRRDIIVQWPLDYGLCEKVWPIFWDELVSNDSSPLTKEKTRNEFIITNISEEFADIACMDGSFSCKANKNNLVSSCYCTEEEIFYIWNRTEKIYTI